MCNYKYEYKKHQLTGSPCIYPAFYEEHSSEFPTTKSLPVDTDGYCIFHSKNKNWKVENGFDEKFIELMKVTEEICKKSMPPKWAFNFSGFHFSQEVGFLKLINWPENAALDFRFCEFINGLTMKNSLLKSIDIANAHFHEILIIENVNFSSGINSTYASFDNGIAISNCALEGYNYFDDCTFQNLNKKSENNFRFKDNISDYLNFENSNFETSVTLERMIFKGEVRFDKASFLDEFYFHDNEIAAEISFKETAFLLSENANPIYSSVDFKKLKIPENGKLIFRGTEPFENMIRGELQISFEAEPEGLISFENFNLNKISLSTKLKLFELEKTGKVEIGQGCRKYYCQTDIFTIAAIKPDQSLILDLVNVFCNYFEIHNHYNLGIEIIERKPDIIRYFFFTDEIISKEEFEKRIKQNEYDLWQTFSNLSNYAGNQLQTNLAAEKNTLIDLAAIFLKIRNRILTLDYNENQFNQLLTSIAIDGLPVIGGNKSLDKIANSFQSFDKQFPYFPVIQPIFNDNSVHIHNSAGSIINTGNQSSVYSTVETTKEDPEIRALAIKSFKWTKKQTIWTIIGVIIATLLSIIGLRLAGYI